MLKLCGKVGFSAFTHNNSRFSEMRPDCDVCCAGADSDNDSDDELCDGVNGEADVDCSSDDDDDNNDQSVSECGVTPMIE